MTTKQIIVDLLCFTSCSSSGHQLLVRDCCQEKMRTGNGCTPKDDDETAEDAVDQLVGASSGTPVYGDSADPAGQFELGDSI